MSGHTPLPADPMDLPLLPLRDVVVFPSMIVPLNVQRSRAIKAVEAAMANHGGKIVPVVQRDATQDEPTPQDLYEIGCVAEILKVFKSTDKALRVGAEGVQRVKIKAFVMRDGYYDVDVEVMEDAGPQDPNLEALWRTVHVVTSAGEEVRSVRLPGFMQEGIARLPDGSFVITQDTGGLIKWRPPSDPFGRNEDRAGAGSTRADSAQKRD